MHVSMGTLAAVISVDLMNSIASGYDTQCINYQVLFPAFDFLVDVDISATVNMVERFDSVRVVTFATPILGAVLAAASLATNKQVGAFSLFAKTLQNSLFAKGVNFFK